VPVKPSRAGRCPDVVYGPPVTCGAFAKGARARATLALTSGSVIFCRDSMASVSVSPDCRAKCWFRNACPGVAPGEVVLRRGPEPRPQHDERGHRGDPHQHGDPAMPITGASQSAQARAQLSTSPPQARARSVEPRPRSGDTSLPRVLPPPTPSVVRLPPPALPRPPVGSPACPVGRT
jgi:hypothetical protein